MNQAVKTFRFVHVGLWLVGGLVVLSACAPSKEFQTVPQKGAWHNGIYPSFSDKPHAETEQFSAADQARLSAKLRAEGKQLNVTASAEEKAQKSRPGAAAVQKQANKEIQDTLRRIQTGK